MTDIIIVSNRPAKSIAKQTQANTPEPHRIIHTGLDASASINRNAGLARVTSDIAVMLDDDITGFYPGWLFDLLEPLDEPDVILSSARLIKPDGTPNGQMGSGIPFDEEIHDVPPSSYKGYRRTTTAAVAFRLPVPSFDEGFIGSGYEDTAWMNELNRVYPGKRMVITNRCRLIHANEMKCQGGKYWEHNHAHYMSLYPDDEATRGQQCWVR